MSMTKIINYHAHVYYSASEKPAAERVRVEVGRQFGDRIRIGNWHDNPVGPHPRGSCQLTVQPEDMADFLPWMSTNRGDLTIFMHLNTGEDYLDHTRHVIWLGKSESLKLEIFKAG